MKHMQKVLLVVSFIIVVFTLTACGSSSGGGSSASLTKPPLFDMYNKVSLGMTKDEVDAALGSAGEPDTSSMAIENTFTYMDADDLYGVYVAYNENNQAYSKTVMYGDQSVLAAFTAKPVTESQEEQIKTGMKYEEVVSILGGEGIECSRGGSFTDFNNSTRIMRWGNTDGSVVQVVIGSDGTAGNVLFQEDYTN